MKKWFLFFVIVLAFPPSSLRSIDDEADDKDIAIIVLSCATAFISAGCLLCWWLVKAEKRELERKLAQVTGNLSRTEGELRAVETHLQALLQAAAIPAESPPPFEEEPPPPFGAVYFQIEDGPAGVEETSW